MKPSHKGLLWIVGMASLTYVLAIELPAMGKWVPWSFEKRLAKSLGNPTDQALCSLDKKPAVKKAWDKLIQRIFPLYEGEGKTITVQFHVIDGSTINAFTWLGGDIFVYKGLLQQAESPEELAAVLSHEIAHATYRHLFQRAFIQLITYGGLQLIFGSSGSELTAMLLNLKFSRQQEHEADQGGLERLQKAHIDVAGFLRFFEKMQKMSSVPALFSDHPADEDRLQFAKTYIQKDTKPILSPEEWKALKHVCGE